MCRIGQGSRGFANLSVGPSKKTLDSAKKRFLWRRLTFKIGCSGSRGCGARWTGKSARQWGPRKARVSRARLEEEFKRRAVAYVFDSSMIPPAGSLVWNRAGVVAPARRTHSPDARPDSLSCL